MTIKKRLFISNILMLIIPVVLAITMLAGYFLGFDVSACGVPLRLSRGINGDTLSGSGACG